MISYASLNGCLKATRSSLTASSKVLAMVFPFLVVDKIDNDLVNQKEEQNEAR